MERAELLPLQPLEHLDGQMETPHSTQTDVRRNTPSLTHALHSCTTIPTLVLNKSGTPAGTTEHTPSLDPTCTLSYSDTSLCWKSLLFFFLLPVMHIMQAHVCLFEVEFDFYSQCCDVDTNWTSCLRLTGQAERRINILILRCHEIRFCQVFQKDILCNLSPRGEY